MFMVKGKKERPSSAESLNELGIIRQIAEKIHPDNASGPLWPGDDAWAGPPDADGMVELATDDTLVEGVHFSWDIFSPGDVGIKLIYACASDIAAMAGTPDYALVSWAVPKNTEREVIAGIAGGIGEACGELNISLVGGDTVATEGTMVLTAFIRGRVESEQLCRRKGAKPGDIIALTGGLGASWSGLAYLRGRLEGVQGEVTFELPVERHLRPKPRLEEARRLAQTGLVTSMADTSDSLSTQLYHLCRASGVGVEIEQESLPLCEGAKAAADFLGVEPLQVALGAGEDFELLITLKPGAKIEDIRLPADLQISLIGRVVEEDRGLSLIHAGSRLPLEETGYMHFKKSEDDIYSILR